MRIFWKKAVKSPQRRGIRLQTPVVLFPPTDIRLSSECLTLNVLYYFEE